MYSAMLAAAFSVWFALLYPMVARRLAIAVPALDAPVRVPFLLVVVFSFMPLVFDIPRDDGAAVLQEGPSASNALQIALTAMTGLYLAYRGVIDRRLFRMPFTMPYLPMTLMFGWDLASTAWSIVPSYTVYRAVEVAIFSLATIQIFDRTDIARRLAPLLALVLVAWLGATSSTIVASVAQGIIFSAAKNNLMPLVCAALMLLGLFKRSMAWRKSTMAFGIVGFVVAGSAASTGALLAAVGPAMMIASSRPASRFFGFILAILALAVFIVLMLGLSNFPVLLDLASTVMQKPASELANATGRGEFWPVFLSATRDHVFGSGFAAGDRFLQLLVPSGDLTEGLGRSTVNFSSAHNMFLSTWAGTGVIGIAFSIAVLGSAVCWGLKLDRSGRRFVIAVVVMLLLNSMTTPGIFQIWTVNNLAFLAVLAYARVGVLQQDSARSAMTERSPPGSRRSFPGSRHPAIRPMAS